LILAATIIAVTTATAASAAAENENDYDNYPAAVIISKSKHFIIPFSAHNYHVLPLCAVSKP